MPNHHRSWKVITITLLIIAIWTGLAWIKFLYFSVVHDTQGIRYNVHTGSSLHSVIDDLYARHIIKNPTFFKILVRLKHVDHELKAGVYLFPKGTTSPKILEQMTTGSGMLYRVFTIVPGWNFRELNSQLLHNEYLHHTLQNISSEEIMKILGHPELKPEGEFLPDSYYFIEGSSDIILLKRAFKAMQDKLNTAWSQRSPNLPFKTSYEALIAASIVEKEAYLEEELPKIAGVMVNRLRKNMLLQFDPTVIYGTGRLDNKISRADLASKNIYNTYVHKGLPPTPIAMPSFAAIQAILHPMQHDYYYFVAQRNRSSQFSERLSEHNKAVGEARKTYWFFNEVLVRYYLVKFFSHKIN